MAKTRNEIVLGLRKLRTELRNANNDQIRDACLRGIDALLDERLKQRGAHPADCVCWECSRTVADVMARRLGECVDPRDLAGEAEYGTAG